jgi:hypothetical protein
MSSLHGESPAGEHLSSNSHLQQSSSSEQGKFGFTQPFYNSSVPENSLGSTMVIPQREKSGIWNAGTREIHYRIEGGDPHQMFRVEPRQVGDFCFLILRVRNNERILNREFKEVYKIQVRAVVYADDEIINNGSAIASALVSGGSELVEEETTYSSTMTKSFENKLLLDTSKLLLLLPSGSESYHKENEVGIDEDNDDDGLNTNKSLKTNI